MNKNLAASTQSQALCALLFFYDRVLGEPLEKIDAFRSARPKRLPTVLGTAEVRALLDRI